MNDRQIELKADIKAALEELAGKRINHIFFVACGGSLAVMHPAKYLLDRQSAALTSDCYNSDEFVYRNPHTLGANSLVVLCSMTGTTKETLHAAEYARAKGATTIGLSQDLNSPLAKAVDHAVKFEAPYTTGVPIDAVDSNYSCVYQIVLGLVRIYDGSDKLERMMASLGNLQAAIDRAHQTYAGLFEQFAPRFKDESVIYTVASGADYGAAYSYAICGLMEMQWINSQAIHANEFFHGPFEVLDRNR